MHAVLLALLLSSAPSSASPVPAPVAEAPAPAPTSNKWRLQFSGAAESAGELVFAIADDAGARYEVSVAIEGNDGENRVAAKVRRALDRELPRGWRVERDDGEDVLVKRRLYHPRFSIVLVRSSVEDVRVGIDRE